MTMKSRRTPGVSAGSPVTVLFDLLLRLADFLLNGRQLGAYFARSSSPFESRSSRVDCDNRSRNSCSDSPGREICACSTDFHSRSSAVRYRKSLSAAVSEPNFLGRVSSAGRGAKLQGAPSGDFSSSGFSSFETVAPSQIVSKTDSARGVRSVSDSQTSIFDFDWA